MSGEIFRNILVEEYLFFWVISKENKSFVAEKKSGLHNRELLKYHEFFPVLVFKGSLSIEISVQRPVSDIIM